MLASRVFRVVYKDVVLFPQKKKKTNYNLLTYGLTKI